MTIIRENQWRAPFYIAVADYHGGVASLLSDYGFAPFSDRVKMVKQVVKWIRETSSSPAAVIDAASEIVPSSFATPDHTVSHFAFSDGRLDAGNAS